MRNIRTATLLILLAVASVPIATATASVDVTISSVEVSPSETVPGGEVTIEPTIENFESSSAGYVVDRVVVVSADDSSDRYGRVDDVGTVPAGSSKTIPLTASFDDPGTYDLRVRVAGRDADTGRPTRLSYPVTVDVRERALQVDVEANDTVVGVQGDGSVTIANSLDSPVEDIELTVEGENAQITNRREVLASLAGDSSRTIEFKYSTDSPGEQTLTATLSYTTAGGATNTVTDEVRIRAREGGPRLDIDTNSSIAGIESDGTVTVANGLGVALTGAELTISGEGVSVRDDRTVFTRVADGESVTAGFDFRPAAAGEQTLTATLTYSTPDGATRSVSETVTVETEQLSDDVALDLEARSEGNSQAVTARILNRGNAPVTSVSVRGRSQNASLQPALVDRVPPGESRTVRLNATMSRDRAAVDVEATYDVGDATGSTTASTVLTRTPGTIELTSLEVRPDRGRLRVSGSASNLGTTDAESVLVSVADTERVTPASPNPEYFVGTVPSSDFVSFDVYASVDGNVSTVPLNVSYLVDGQQYTRTVDVDAAGASRALAAGPESSDGGSSGGFLLPATVGGIVVLAVAGVVARAWRNSRGSD